MSEASPPAPKARQGSKGRWLIIGLLLLIMFLIPMLLFAWLQGGPGLVNPNTATREQLLALPGLGPELANRILQLRPFTDEADFEKRVPGISPKLLEEIRTRLDFDGDGEGDCCVVH